MQYMPMPRRRCGIHPHPYHSSQENPVLQKEMTSIPFPCRTPDRSKSHPGKTIHLYRAILEMQNQVFVLCKQKGWYDKPVDFPTSIALLHSEVSEALKAWREHGFETFLAYHPEPECEQCHTATALRNASEEDLQIHPEWADVICPKHPLKPEDVGSEFADILIRLLDDAERYGIDLVYEFERKMTYNWTRPYRHGCTNPEGI